MAVDSAELKVDLRGATRIVLVVDGLNRAAIDRLWAALSGAPGVDGPDLAALADNPLVARHGGLLA